MKKKILIFISQPIDNRNKCRLGYNELIDNFDYQLIDVSLLFNNKIKDYQKIKNYNNKEFILIKSYKELYLMLKKINNNFFFLDLTTYKSIPFTFFQILLVKKNGIKFDITGLNLPSKIFESKSSKLKKLFRLNKFFDLFKKISFFMHYRFCNLFIPSPVIAFTSGNKDSKKNIKNCKIILSHSLDYETYITNQEYIFKSNNKYIIYLDQMYFYHPEFIISNTEYSEKKKNLFYEELQSFFNVIVNHFNYDIYILSHPRSDNKYLEYLSNFFLNKGVSVIKHKNSHQYYKNSEFIVCHTSSSFQFAILHKKPILFTFSNHFDEYTKNYVYALANELGNKPINLSHEISKKDIKLNETSYHNYIRNYITENNTYRKSYWKIINDELNNL